LSTPDWAETTSTSQTLNEFLYVLNGSTAAIAAHFSVADEDQVVSLV
jgi:hypothetical protein